MSWLESKNSALLKQWLESTSCPMISSTFDGKILWCNSAFEKLLGYTFAEVTSGDVNWRELTIDNKDLDADVQMAEQLVEGRRQMYEVQKAYRRKDGQPCKVSVHVMRFPSGDEEFECFLATINPLDGGYEYVLENVDDMRKQMIELFAHIKNPPPSLGHQALEWAKINPWKAGVVVCVIMGMLFGENFTGVLETVIQIFRGIPVDPPA